MNRYVEVFLRVLTFLAAAAIATFGVLSTVWPLIYFTAPLFVPFTGYQQSVMGSATPFARHPALWNGVYVATVAAAAAIVTLRKRPFKTFMLWMLMVVGAAVVTHLLLNARGYYFVMEAP